MKKDFHIGSNENTLTVFDNISIQNKCSSFYNKIFVII